MLNRLALATIVTVAAMNAAIGQTDKAVPRKSDTQPLARTHVAPDTRPPEEKWVEESIDKFFAIPEEILDPQPARR